MTVANNIKSTIKNTEDAKEFMKSVEKCSQSESADKSLAGTLMSTLTNIKFDGSRTIHEHILEMTNLAARLKTMGMEVNENFLGFLTTRITNPNERLIFMGNRVKVPVEAVGTYRLTLDTGHHLDLYGTFYVPSISRNLISLSKLDTSVERQLDRKVKILRSDRVGEYYGKYDENGQCPGPFAKFLESHGICAQYTMLGTPQQNGVAKRVPSKSVPKTPFELWTGRKPSLRHLHVWGCQVEYEKVETGNVRFIENDIISGSLEPRKVEIQEVRVEIPSSITSSQVVVPVVVDAVNNPQEQQINVQTPHNDIVTNEPVTEEPQEIELRRFVRSRRSAISDDYLVYWHESEFDLSIDNDPVSFSQVIKRDNSTKWLDAMKEELKSMNDNEVWDLVEFPKESKRVGCKWVFKTKRDSNGNIERYKARLVAKGYTQKDDIDYKETFSPVSKKDSLRIIMALVAHYDLELYQMDVKTAFLNGNLDEEVFMDQPEGFMVEGKEHMVCKLKRYQSNPGMDHWKAAKKVLRYLQGTKDYMLTYKRSDHLEVIGYSDSDFLGCVDTRKSTFGYLFLLAEGAISWKSAKQSIIAASTMEVEFVACFEATVHGLWLRNFISGLGIIDSIVKPLRIYCDNSAAVFF
ncbi:Retrovirus-related Pol polyprotein from transposon TNT 1-94 [Cucumis melo var. makuwa]|uniref:Retrovirus-related Pol polyprotein from transposon TNT 1-94 n=1 Tax=Cucumis melo var. makuwa TaxID=1194695 RepID=A0A5A7SLM2_CUCMM|nr:Retrovirus-related Pol polyprotein from transposon TNT 1-94 [Cucumis melo var. makuwa]